MKKATVLAFFLLFILTLSACAGGEEQSAAPHAAVPPQSSAAEAPAEAAPALKAEEPVLPPPADDPGDAPQAEPSPDPADPPQPPSSPGPSDPPQSGSAPTGEQELAPPVSSDPQPAPGDGNSAAVYHEKVPILMYHEVNDLLANSLFLSVADFTSHLTYFAEAGITPITMQQLYDHWFNEAPLPEKPVVLTFDDGYTSMYTTVYPLLKERGWSGTFYCITNLRWSEGHLSEEQIREMAAGGMEIGSHTVSHLELNTLSRENLYHELTVSKNVLSDFAGADVPILCYPAGRYDEATKIAAAETGYLSAVTTQYGFASKAQGMFDLKRIRISSGCGAAWLENALSPLGY